MTGLGEFMMPKNTLITCINCKLGLLISNKDCKHDDIFERDNFDLVSSFVQIMQHVYLPNALSLANCGNCSNNLKTSLDEAFIFNSYLKETTEEENPRYHSCTYKKYIGFTKEYDYCTICDKRENQKP